MSLKKCIPIKCNELDSQVEQTCKEDIFITIGEMGVWTALDNI